MIWQYALLNPCEKCQTKIVRCSFRFPATKVTKLLRIIGEPLDWVRIVAARSGFTNWSHGLRNSIAIVQSHSVAELFITFIESTIRCSVELLCHWCLQVDSGAGVKAIGDSAMNYTWLPGQAAIIIPRPHLKGDDDVAGAGPSSYRPVTSGEARNNQGLWHTTTAP